MSWHGLAMELELTKEKRELFSYFLFFPKEIFSKFIIYLVYSVLNALSEYTYFYKSKKITSYNFVACF